MWTAQLREKTWAQFLEKQPKRSIQWKLEWRTILAIIIKGKIFKKLQI